MSPASDGWYRMPISSLCCSRCSCCCTRSRIPIMSTRLARWIRSSARSGSIPSAVVMRPDLGDSGHSTIDEIEHLEAVQEQMTIALQNYPNSGITMKIDDRGLVISLSAAKFFSSGESEIAPSQLPVLDAVIKTITPLANPLEIDGFTDSVPIQSGMFRDNWELSAARAAVVLRYMLAHSAMTPDRFEIAGYGPYRSGRRQFDRRRPRAQSQGRDRGETGASPIHEPNSRRRKRRQRRFASTNWAADHPARTSDCVRAHPPAVAQAWSDSMAEHLPSDAPLEFERLDFDAFASVSLDESPCAQIALFSIASTPIQRLPDDDRSAREVSGSAAGSD